MARIRDTYIENQLALGNAGVQIVPINIVDPISELIIGVRATAYLRAEENYAHDVFTKCELVDGSDVLMSMGFKQLQAMHFYNRGVVPHMGIFEWELGEARAYQSLIFGRDAMDFDYAFDPTMFRNPQLRITWNLAEINPVDDPDGFADGTAKLTVIARCIEEAPRKPGAFFMTKELFNWATAASGDEPIVLPTDYPYRMLMVRSYRGAIGTACSNFKDITKLKMSCDQDAYVPFQYDTRELLWLMEQWWGLARTSGKYYVDAADWKPVFIEGNPVGHMDIYAGAYGGIQDCVGAQAQIYCSADDHGGLISFMGSGYHSTWCIPFGTPGTPEEWFDATKYKSIRLLASQGNALAAASVVLQQIRPNRPA